MAKSIKNIINDTDRKSYIQIAKDLVRLLIKYKNLNSLGFYATNLMYKKNCGNINDYVPSDKLMSIINNYYIIEANDNPHVRMMQTSSKGLNKNPIYKKLFSEI